MATTLLAQAFARAVAPVFALLCTGGAAWGQPFEWQQATPESQGMSGKKLDALKDELAKRKTRALLVIRNDKIVSEWYAEGQDPAKTQGTASLAKAIVGGLSLSVSLSDGRIKLDDPATKYIPGWKDDSRKSKITIRQLGSHTSGLADSTTPGVKNEDQPSWMGEFWKRLPPPNDPFTLARDKTPMLFDPGTKFQYSNPGIGMLTYCVTASLKGAPQQDIRALLRERVMRPLGVPDAEWSVGYGKTFTVNDLPLVGSWGGGSFTPRAAARVGRLVLRAGDWDGQRILSRDAVRQITQDAGFPGHCGMGWWTNAAGRYPYLPKDAVWGAGAGDQVLLVIPSLKLIVVRNGETLPTTEELKQAQPKDVFEEFHDPRAKILFEPLIDALAQAPVPLSAGQAASAASKRPLHDLDSLRQAAMNKAGDPIRGKAIYLSAEAKCATCHKVHGQGEDIGPDLSQIAGKFDRTHLIESILDPSAEIPQGYHSTILATQSGRVVTGIVKSESAAAVTIIDPEAKQVTIPLRDIESREVSKVSLMPAGLADVLTTAEFTDLIAYLATLRTGRSATPGEGVTGPLTLPRGFEAEVVATGFTGATALVVAHDGRTFVCEQTGTLRVIKNGKLLAEPFVKLPVDSAWERGLIGVALAPDFPKTPHVFVCYVAAKPYPHHVVSRLVAARDVAAPGSEKILLEGDDQTKLGGTIPAGHQGGAIHFGKDGKLYVAIGDQTAGEPAQRLDTFQGKMLRINPDGSIPGDNPFVKQTTGKYRAIWAVGLRNPFAFAVEPGTGRIFIDDVGGKAEEINEGIAGANYGWPAVEHGPTSDPRFRGPIHHYPTACITGGAFAPVDLPWPAQYQGQYFFADFNHGWIQTIDPAHPAVARPFAVGIRRPVDLLFAPDRSLLVLVRDAWVIDKLFEPGTGAVIRIRHTGPSHALPGITLYPPSPVIGGVTWAPKESIVRQAKGSDNWPLTWADDDLLYTAYGDGNGFEPFVPEKLSMGLATVAGTPPEFAGVNLRAATAEFKGDGPAGRKASGILMVEGVLYLWARNLGNSQLAWSADHGKTWAWSDWKFANTFGCPTFLNFGKNYAGARDDYVYVYSHDHDSAYEVADRMVLARVPKTRIKEQAAYEYFQALDDNDEATWTKDVAKRGAVFDNPRKCYRSGISYNAALDRYLWCQILPDSKQHLHGVGLRNQGGLGIFDAPEPWGPWSTVYYTDDWDVGPGESASFPTKWMSADGQTLYLVFSGNDCFSVRKANLLLFRADENPQPKDDP